jgi:hypothetical protein
LLASVSTGCLAVNRITTPAKLCLPGGVPA